MMTVGSFWNRYGLSRVSPALRSQMPGADTAATEPLRLPAPLRPRRPRLLRRDALLVLDIIAAGIELH